MMRTQCVWQNRRLSKLVMVVSSCCFLGLQVGMGGDGEYVDDQAVTCLDGQSRTLDLMNVSLFIDQDPAGTPSSVETWSNQFVTASQRIWNFTETQAALNEVIVYRRTRPGGVDIVSQAREWPRATPYRPGGFLGFGAAGLGGGGQIFLPANMANVLPGRNAGAVIAHEFGHYAFGLGDDYKVYTRRDSDGQYLTASRDTSGAISAVTWTGSKTYSGGMSFNELRNRVSPTGDGTGAGNAFRASPSTVMNHEVHLEVSTQGNHYLPWAGTVTHGGTVHNVSFSIHQHDMHSQSAWETLRDDRGLTIPTNLVDNAAGYATEMPPLQWILTELHPSSVVCLDRSGSMGPDYHEQGIHLLPTAIAGANKAVDNASVRQQPLLGIWGEEFPGDNVGIVSYASDTSIDAALAEIVDGATKTSHKASISGLTANGGTAIGDGLRTCLNELTRENGATAPAGESEMVILLSDGEHNDGEDPEGLILTELVDRNVRLHTVALGPAVDAGLMRRLADATGGKSRRITDASELDQFFAEIYTESRDASALTDVVGSIDTSSDTRQVLVDPFGNMDLTFNLFWESGDLDLHLEKPDGTVIDHVAAANDPDVELIESARSEFLRVIAPEPGVWIAHVIPVTPGGPQAYLLQVASLGQNNARLHLETTGSVLTHPAPLLISARFSGPFSGVSGVDVSGLVTRPDGSAVPFTLYDDGNPSHGDQHPNDGIYVNQFTDFSVDGEYTFTITGNNVDGQTCMSGFYSGVPDGGGIPAPEPVPPFSRQRSVTVVYDGIPEFINATPYTETDFASWLLDRSTGAMVGSLIVSNRPDSVKTLIEPFWYAVTETHNVMLATSDGMTDEGDPYVDVTAKVNAALQVKYGRQNMAPGEWVVIDGISVYSRDRSIPDMTAVWSLWADPPGMGDRRIDNYDINADGVLGDSEILLAVQNWYANDMPDYDLLRRIELWKQGPNPFEAD